MRPGDGPRQARGSVTENLKHKREQELSPLAKTLGIQWISKVQQPFLFQALGKEMTANGVF
jgi:hypothetical protein